MDEKNPLPVSDLYRLALLDLHKIPMIRSEWNGRFWGFFEAAKATPVLHGYEAGRLKVNARDFVDSLKRTKDRIFENERLERNGANDGRNIARSRILER